jgi:putative transposase
VAQSLGRNYVHIVFSTKYPVPLIPRAMSGDLYAYLAGICTRYRCAVHAIGGMPDHVHIACTLHRTIAMSDLVEEVKKSSSKWMKASGVRQFSWQGGYGGFSFGQSQLARVVRYISRQEEHHRLRTYEEEFIRILQHYEVDYDERYLWD